MPTQPAPRPPSGSGGPPVRVSAILAVLRELGAANERVTIASIIEKLGDRSYGPVLLVPALIGISPVGAIPGVPAFLAAIMALVALQLACGRAHLWLPQTLRQRSIAGPTLRDAAERLAGLGERLDRVFHGRLERLTDDPFPELAAIIVLLLCVMIVPLELLPFAVALPMGAIAAFGLALTVRDGALMLASLAASGLAGWLALAAMAPS